MKKKLFLPIAVMTVFCLLFASCSSTSEENTTTASDDTEVTEEGRVLDSPTDFEFDPVTGEYSFVAVDEEVAYYFVRIYPVNDGVVSTEYKAASSRIAGGVTGTITGTVELPAMGWGTFLITLNSYAVSGSGNERAETVSLTAYYGVGLTLERPEMLAMISGNQVELVIDWFTLSDYYDYEYLPEMKFTFYSDPECTTEVRSETVDLQELEEIVYSHPVGYNWGSSYTEDTLHYYHSNGELSGFGPYVGESDYAFTDNIYTYTLDAGTYYVTCQAISKLDYTYDSQESTPIEITLTDEEPTEEFTTATTELWVDPTMSDIPSTRSAVYAERVDFCGDQPISAELVEEG